MACLKLLLSVKLDESYLKQLPDIKVIILLGLSCMLNSALTDRMRRTFPCGPGLP